MSFDLNITPYPLEGVHQGIPTGIIIEIIMRQAPLRVKKKEKTIHRRQTRQRKIVKLR